MTEQRADTSLLIVDDRADVRRGLVRYFTLYVARVFAAETPEEAEALIVEHQPELLLCDYWLGTEHPPGTLLVERWRAAHPCIRRAALMTGTKATSIMPTDGIDRIFEKPLSLPEVKDWLLLPGG